MINIPNSTTNYNLSKPLGSERVDVNVLNQNMDIIDSILNENSNNIAKEKNRLDNLALVANSGNYNDLTNTPSSLPASDVYDWAKRPNKPTYTAIEVGADTSGTAASIVAGHDTSSTSHNDIRLLIKGLQNKVTTILDSDDETLDQLSEIVTYIKNNKTLIDAITDKIPTKVSQLVNDSGFKTTDNNTTYKLSKNGSNILLSGSDGSSSSVQDSSGTSITVDTALSSTSTNPVQNKAVYTGLASKANSRDVLPVTNTAEVYSSLTSFWTAFESVAKRTSSTSAIMRFSANNDWFIANGWFRCLVSCQNFSGNGSYEVTGSIIVLGGGIDAFHYGIVTGGINGTSDLTLRWVNPTIRYSVSEPTSFLTTNTVWIG